MIGFGTEATDSLATELLHMESRDFSFVANRLPKGFSKYTSENKPVLISILIGKFPLYKKLKARFIYSENICFMLRLSFHPRNGNCYISIITNFMNEPLIRIKSQTSANIAYIRCYTDTETRKPDFLRTPQFFGNNNNNNIKSYLRRHLKV